MSYLLTEIALDMLGYKFYDINGIYQTTDFQSISSTPPQNSDEPSLEDILYPKEQSKSQERSSTDSSEYPHIPNLPIPRITVSQDQLVMLNIRESIDKEIKLLYEELKKRKPDASDNSHTKSTKNKDKNTANLSGIATNTSGIKGKKSLRREAKRLTSFLNCVEKSLEEANPEHFKELKGYKMNELL